MKLFEDSLAARTEADVIRILLTCDPSDYPELRESARREAERLEADRREASRLVVDANYRVHGSETTYSQRQFRAWVVTVAEVITWEKKTFPMVHSNILLQILKEESIADHLSKSPPPWLESAFSKFWKENPYYDNFRHDFLEVCRAFHLYIVRSCIPMPEEGHGYYGQILVICHELPAYSEENVLFHLRRFPVVINELLPRALRMMTVKNNSGYLIEQEIEWWENGRKLAEGEKQSVNARHHYTDRYFATPLARALIELAKQGEIDRLPILRICLEAIGDASREIETRQLRRCHDFFAADFSELQKLFDAYLSLLSSPFPPVVKFAVDHLQSLFCECASEQVSELLSEIPPALTHTKSRPLILETVRLVRKIVERNPSTYSTAVEQIVQVLSLPAPDIQKEILGVLGLGTEEEQGRVRPLLAPFRTQITGSLKKSFDPWFADVIEKTKPEAPPEVKLESREQPLGEAIVSLKNIDDMVFAANALLSRSPDPMLLELWMDGLARLSAESRALLAKALTPLHKRALKKIDPKESWDIPCWIERLGAELIVRCGPESDAGRFRWITQSAEFPQVMSFLILRLLEILDPTRPPRTLIGTPEFSLGFIRIGTLFNRTTSQLESVGTVDHCDFIQGIARALPDAEALVSAQPTDPEPLRVLHFLASGEILGKVETGVWWITAARIRDPQKDYSDEPAFTAFADEERPDWLQPARYSEVGRRNSDSLYYTKDLLDIPQHQRKVPPKDALLSLRFGSIAMCSNQITNCDADIRWLFSVAPSHLEPILGQALALTQGTSGLTPGPLKTAIPLIFGEISRRQPPLGKAMRLHLLYNLASNLAPCREATPELWLQAEVGGLLEPAIPDLAEYFRRIIQEPHWFDLMRVNPGLQAIKDIHPNLPIRLRDILLGAFSQGLESSPRSLGKTLDLLLSLLIDYPPKNAPDLSALAASPLGSKELGIVKKIIKALGR